MDKDRVFKMLKDSLTALYGFSYAKTNNAEDAEDLMGDIITEVISRSESIRNEKSFYGFMWAVAKNLSVRYFRNKKYYPYVIYDENTMPAVSNTPENELIANEEILLLRRELSLLAKRHRDIVVKYYIENKTCIEIASETGLSHSLVRYILCQTRKILKEGVNMERTYGERSYSPQEFELCGYFSFSNYDHYKPFRERKLPGNILLSLYDRNMTVTELSLELGVSAPYLEDELNMLSGENLISEKKGRYTTTLPIFDDEYFDSFEALSEPIVTKASEEILSMLENITLPINTSSAQWLAFFLAMRFGVLKATDKGWAHIGGAPMLTHGSQGVLCGKTSRKRDYILMNMNGYSYNAERTAYITHYCYNSADIHNAEYLDLAKHKALTDIMLAKRVDLNSKSVLSLIENGLIRIENGEISVLFPIVTENEMIAAKNVLEPISSCAEAMLDALSKCAENLAYTRAPKNIKDAAGKAAYMSVMSWGLGMVYDRLKNELTLPQNSSFVGVVRNS